MTTTAVSARFFGPSGGGTPRALSSRVRFATSKRLFLLSLALFSVAAFTGFAYRLAAQHGAPFGLSVGHIRQAHSHLMFMGWLTPALMLLIFAALPRTLGRSPSGRAALYLSLGLGALAFPAFLAFGYGPANVAGLELPLAAILSALTILAWYGVALAYARRTWGVKRTLALRAWDIAFALLGWSTVGAWAQAAGMFAPMSYGLRMATLHLFLDGFGGGWFVFGLLGLIAHARPELDRPAARRALLAAAAATPFTFLLALDADLLSGTGLALRHAAAGVAGAGLFVFAALALKARGRPCTSLLALALYALGLAGAASPWVLDAAMQAGLRLPFLHLLFLGAASTGVFAAGARTFGLVGRGAFEASALLVLASLLPLTWLWPEAWGGAWRLTFATIAALGPGLAVTLCLIHSLSRPRRPSLGSAMAARR